MTACVSFTLFPFNHIIKQISCFTWHFILPITSLLQLEKGEKVFFHSFLCLLSPQLGILWLPTPVHALHWWRDTALSHLKSRTHLKCTTVWNVSIICLTCLKLANFPYLVSSRTKYRSIPYKPDEIVKLQPPIHNISEWAHNTRRKSRYYLSYGFWTEQRMQIFT